MSSKQEFEKILTELPEQRKDILFRLLRGETDEQIATTLTIHQGTVRKQVSNLVLDFGLGNNGKAKRTDLVAIAAKYCPKLLQQETPSIDLNNLTDQQKKVLSHVLAGYKDTDIATSLGIQPSTVRKHIERIYKQVNLSSDRKTNRNDLFKTTARIYPEIATETNPKKIEEIMMDVKMINNPFWLGSGAVEEPHFYRRDKEVDYIFNILNSWGNIALFGECGIGKSSLLREVIRQSQNRLTIPRKPIFMHLCLICSEDEFYEYLCDELEIETCKGYNLIKAIREHGGILLVLDEMGMLTYSDFSCVKNQLTSFSQISSIQLLTASIYSLSAMFPDQDRLEAHRFHEYQVGGWDEITIREMICDRLNSPLLNPEYKSITFSENEVKGLINDSNGNPQKVMRLCHFLFRDKKDALSS